MRLINDIQDVPDTREPKSAAEWTAIIPAAGRGSRLNFDGPKLLYPVMGKPILDWLIQLLEPLCGELLFVVSPEGEGKLAGRVRTVLQDSPTGMADAIWLCEAAVRTPYVVVIWGDQITVRPQTLAACMNALESSPSALAVIPTIERESPYIHFIREVHGRIVAVYEARETDQALTRGENDCGVFLFRTKALFQVLRETRGNPAYRGKKTGEENFLSLIPLFHKEPENLITLRLQDPGETIGINTPADAEQASQILKGRDR